MSVLSQGPRLNARTTPRIHNAIRDLATDLTRNGLRFGDRTLPVEALISAIVSGFLELSREEQTAYLKVALPKLEKEVSKYADSMKSV